MTKRNKWRLLGLLRLAVVGLTAEFADRYIEGRFGSGFVWLVATVYGITELRTQIILDRLERQS